MRISALLALALLCDSANAQRIITSLTAGNGDGGPATATRFALLGGMAFDALGNLYFSERGAHAIRRITPSGIISTYAGNGQTGFGVSDVAATSTSVESPNSITLDSRGNLFIVDATRERIRRVSPNGVISTLVSGVRPESIAVDTAGNLYFADPGNARIRCIDPAGIITTFAGNGTAGFSGDGGPATSAAISYPTGIAFDPAGNLLICDSGNKRIRRVTPAGIISTVAGNGTDETTPGARATATAIPPLTKIAVDSGGNIAFAFDSFVNSSLYRVNTFGSLELLVPAAKLPDIRGLVYDSSGNLLFSMGDRIHRLTPGGALSIAYGGTLLDGAPAANTRIIPDQVASFAGDAAGNLVVGDRSSRVLRLASGNIATYSGDGVSRFPDPTPPADGTAISAFVHNRLTSLATAPNGEIYFADYNRIFRVTLMGLVTAIAGDGTPNRTGDGGPATLAAIQSPIAMIVDSTNNLYLSTCDGSIRRISSTGIITNFAGNGTYGFSGDGGPATDASLTCVAGLALDSANNLIISDTYSRRIRRITPAGIISTLYGTGALGSAGDGGPATAAQFNVPAGLAFDPSNNLYVADKFNHRIRRITPAGIISTYAGSGNIDGGFAGDGGPATSARLSAPNSLSIDAAGNLYIHDTGNLRIRKVTPDVAPVLTSFATVPAGLNLTVAGITYSTPVAIPLAPGSTVTIAAPSPQTTTARYGFLSWSDSGALSHTITIANTPTTYTATFGCDYDFVVSSASASAAAGSGSFSVAEGTGACAIRPTLTSNAPFLTATLANFRFTYTFTANPGPQRSGTISVGASTFTLTQRAVAPSATDSGPLSASGLDQTITFGFSHPLGFTNLGVLNVLINRVLDGGNACYIAYSQPAGILFLVKDGGPDAGLSDPLVLGSSASVSNSQCTVRGTGSSAVGNGNNFALTLNLSFAPAFGGSKVIYTAARDTGAGNSGWKTIGVSLIPDANPTFPRTGPMTPATIRFATQTVTVTYTDSTSTANIVTGWMLINSAVDGGQACYVAYYAPANLIFLIPDNGDGAQATSMVLSSTNTLENSQCLINAQGSSTSTAGGQLTLNLKVTVKAAFAGPRGVWTAMQNMVGQVSPWRIAGSWLVP